jgi:hypothetical protein
MGSESTLPPGLEKYLDEDFFNKFMLNFLNPVTGQPWSATPYDEERVAGMTDLEAMGFGKMAGLTGVGTSPTYASGMSYLDQMMGGAPPQANQWRQDYLGAQQNLAGREQQGIDTAQGGQMYQTMQPTESNISKWKSALPTMGGTETYGKINQLIGGATDPGSITQLWQQAYLPQAQRALNEQLQQIGEDYSMQGTPYGTQQAYAQTEARQKMGESTQAKLAEMLMGGQERAMQGAGILAPLAQTEYGGGIEALKLSETEASRLQEGKLRQAQMDLDRWNLMQQQEGMKWQDITQLGAQQDMQRMQQGYESQNEALQRQLQAMQYIPEMEMLPWEQAGMAMDYGERQRQIDQAGLDADYEEELRLMTENNPYMQNFYQMISAFMGAEQPQPEGGK